MKKVYKILISCAAGLLVFGAGFASGASASPNLNKYNGAIIDNAVEGTGEYDWRKHDVHIVCDSGEGEGVYKTNHDDDCIYNVDYFFYDDYDSMNNRHFFYLEIDYDQDFSAWDDLETFMVLTNGVDSYTTYVETSHTDFLYDYILIGNNNGFVSTLRSYYISEIWVRTVD